MSYPRKVSDRTLLRSYARTASVWKTAKRVGICGQSVWERLVKLGAVCRVNVFSEEDKAKIAAQYESGITRGDGKLAALAQSLGRDRHSVCRQARRMGLTNPRCGLTPERMQDLVDSARAYSVVNGHPKGMKGKTHSPETKARIAKASLDKWANMSKTERTAMTLKQLLAKAARGPICGHHPHGNWRAGWRDIGDQRIYARSRWEANYGRYLEWLRVHGEVVKWEHEPETFWFEGVRRGTVSYLPDFRVTWPHGRIEYHEVKGWMDSRSRTALKRMKKYHPDVIVLVKDSTWFKAANRNLAGVVPGWER